MSKYLPVLLFMINIVLMGCNGVGKPIQSILTPTNTPFISTPTDSIQEPSRTPTLTPTPEVRVLEGDRSLFNGDYDLARQEYQNAYNASNEEIVRTGALWGLGRVEYLSGYFDQSIAYLIQLISTYPNSELTKRGYFLLGQCYDALQRYQEATTAYSEYISSNPGVIDAYIQEILGDSFANNGDFESALGAYQNSLQSNRIGDTIELEKKIAQMYASIEDYTSSLAIYENIYTRTTDDYYKAQMDFLIGQLYLYLGETEKAYQYFSETVEKYPYYYDSYSALVALVDAGVPVDDFDRGLVDYFAGQYGVALDAFNRYLINHPDHDGTVLHYLAYLMIKDGEYQNAVDYWTLLIEKYPENIHWETAWEERADTLWIYLDDFQSSSQSLINFAEFFPNNQYAPLFLNTAAIILERGGQLEAASNIWQELAVRYSTSDLVPDALFKAGISLYRLSEYDRAQVIFQKDLIFSNLPDDQARAYLWIGKTQQALADNNGALQSFQLAASLDPTGYYSERARSIILGLQNFEPPRNYDLDFDIVSERAEAETWIRITFNLPPETDLSGVSSLTNDSRFTRGSALWELGLSDLARLEFEDLRLSVAENPIDSYRLANYLYDLGLYRVAIDTSRQLLKLAGLQTYTQMLTAPRLFIHINYGAYFKELVVKYADEFKFDPLFLFSVITQESSFEGFVRSSAGARGLMQIIPSTGQSISNNLGWPINFTPEDLYRPYINIRLGTAYLASNRTFFNGDLYSSLAAYNAGPGNANIWNDLSFNDPDLFLEIIRYSETRDYIRHIYEIYLVYHSTYGSNP